MSDWFSSIAKSAQEAVDYGRKMAEEAAKMAEAEINAAKAQIEEEEARVKVEVDKTEVKGTAHLPWETDDEKLAILSEDVMERVKALSLNSKNFEIEPPLFDTFPFVFSENVATAMRLLQLDENLAKMHAKLSLKMNEEVFWHHYFFRIKYLRLKLGIEKIKPLEIKGNPLTKIKKLAEDDVLFKPIVVVPKPTPTPTTSSTKPTQPSSSSSSSSQTAAATASTVGVDEGGVDSTANEGEKVVSKEAMEARRKREAALEAEIDAEMENDLDFDIDIDLDGVNVDDMGDWDVDELDVGDVVTVTKKATPAKTVAASTPKPAVQPTVDKKPVIAAGKSPGGKDNDLDDEIEREIELELQAGNKKK